MHDDGVYSWHGVYGILGQHHTIMMGCPSAKLMLDPAGCLCGVETTNVMTIRKTNQCARVSCSSSQQQAM